MLEGGESLGNVNSDKKIYLQNSILVTDSVKWTDNFALVNHYSLLPRWWVTTFSENHGWWQGITLYDTGNGR
jgi:hypothetical protein